MRLAQSWPWLCCLEQSSTDSSRSSSTHAQQLPFSKGPVLKPAPQAAVPQGPLPRVLSLPLPAYPCRPLCAFWTRDLLFTEVLRGLLCPQLPQERALRQTDRPVWPPTTGPHKSKEPGLHPFPSTGLPEALGQIQACTLSLIPVRLIFSPVMGNDYAVFIL